MWLVLRERRAGRMGFDCVRWRPPTIHDGREGGKGRGGAACHRPCRKAESKGLWAIETRSAAAAAAAQAAWQTGAAQREGGRGGRRPRQKHACGKGLGGGARLAFSQGGSKETARARATPATRPGVKLGAGAHCDEKGGGARQRVVRCDQRAEKRRGGEGPQGEGKSRPRGRARHPLWMARRRRVGGVGGGVG